MKITTGNSSNSGGWRWSGKGLGVLTAAFALLSICGCIGSLLNPVITTNSLPNGIVGVPYSATVNEHGGEDPLTFSFLGSVPDGVVLNPTSGVLAGTPTEPGSYDFTVQVESSGPNAGTNSQEYVVLILGIVGVQSTGGGGGDCLLSDIGLFTTTLPNAVAGTAYSTPIQACGGASALNWSVSAGSSLPAGLTLSTAGVLSGNATTPGNYTFNLQVTDSGTPPRTTLPTQLKLFVGSSTVAITTSALPDGTAGQTYSQVLSATGGAPPYTYGLAAGSGPLPAGLTLATNGTISGAPTASGSFPFTAKVTDSSTPVQTNTKALSINIHPAPVISVLIAPTSASLAVNATQSFTATVQNDAANRGVNWTLAGPAGGCTGAACGTIAPASTASGVAATYTAPNSAPSPNTVTLTATSVSDPSKSNAATITIAANSPVPAIQTLAPATTMEGSGTLTLTVNGTNFVSSSAVQWNGSARATTFVSATRLSAAISAADVATAGIVPVTVMTPTPGGGTSNAVNFTITNPVPVVSSLSATSAVAGSSAFNLTVNGTGYVSSSVVQWNGSARATTFVSATQLTAAISAADLATAGTFPVTVANPAPGGGTSNTVNFTVTAPPPVMPGVLSLVSATGNGPSSRPAASLDGRFVALVSSATNLTSDPTGGQASIFLRDTCTGAVNCTPSTILVSKMDPSFSATPNGGSDVPAITPDGRFVSFDSDATHLIPGGTQHSNVYRRRACANGQANCTESTTLISVNSAGAEGDDRSHNSSISANGRFVAFQSQATNLSTATNPGDLAFVRDTCFEAPAGCTPSTTLVSVDNGGNVPSLGAFSPSISADGRYVAFAAAATNFPPQTGSVHAYLRDTCAGAPAGCTPSTILASAIIDVQDVAISADGRYVAMTSNVTTNAGPLVKEVSVADTCTGAPAGCALATMQVSVTRNNAVPNGDSADESISADGRFVAYFSADSQQVAGDTNSANDVFVRDTCAGGPAGCVPQTARISVDHSGTQSNGDSGTDTVTGLDGVGLASNGQAAAFLSKATNLVSPASNGLDNIFLADTGFRQPGLALTLTALSPGSATHGGGDLVLTITGAGFLPGAAAQWNGAARDTIYINATELEVFIPAADIANAGNVQIAVVNPAPGSGTGTLTFAIN